MTNILKIDFQSQTVSARELYNYLGVKRDFTTWIKSKIGKYGFKSGLDFWLTQTGERKAHNKTDYILTLNMAKELAMLTGNEKGKLMRLYFLECERRLKEQHQHLSQLDAEELETYRHDDRIRLKRRLLNQQAKHNRQKRKAIESARTLVTSKQTVLTFNI